MKRVLTPFRFLQMKSLRFKNSSMWRKMLTDTCLCPPLVCPERPSLVLVPALALAPSLVLFRARVHVPSLFRDSPVLARLEAWGTTEEFCAVCSTLAEMRRQESASLVQTNCSLKKTLTISKPQFETRLAREQI